MASRYVRDNSVVLVGAETTSGVYLLPTVVLNLERGTGLWEPKFDTDESDPMSAHHGSKQTSVITDFASVEADISLKLPSDVAIVEHLMGATGLVGASSSTDIEFTYSSTDQSTLSLDQKSLRQTTKLYGGRADLTITAEIGKAVEASFKTTAQLSTVVTLDPLDPDNALDTTPLSYPVFMTKNCAAYLVNGEEAHFTKVEFMLGADVKQPKDTCAGACYTADIKPELKVSMKADPTNIGAFEELKNGTEFNFVIPFFAADGTKKWDLLIPKAVPIAQKSAKSDGLITLERTFECRKTDGDDNFTMVYYI